jgi:hypothetical protein
MWAFSAAHKFIVERDMASGGGSKWSIRDILAGTMVGALLPGGIVKQPPMKRGGHCP